MCIAGDTIGLEVLPSEEQDVFLPVHAYMFATAGAQIIEVVDMNEIAAEKQYEFAFLGSAQAARRDGRADAVLRGAAAELTGVSCRHTRRGSLVAVSRGPAARLRRRLQGLEVALERPLRSATLLDLLLQPADLVLRPVPVRDLARERLVILEQVAVDRVQSLPHAGHVAGRIWAKAASSTRRPSSSRTTSWSCTRSASSRSRSNASASTACARRPSRAIALRFTRQG